MATTTNFGWETPDDTDLVKDGAAAIRTALGGVDTSFVDLKGGTTGQVLAKASNTDLDFVWSADAAGMTNPMTTTGDMIYSSSGSTPARRAIGSTGQVLTVSGGLPTWATPSSPADNYTLINTGGTALTGATTVTISGISGKNKLMIWVDVASSVNASDQIWIRFNADSGSNYTSYSIDNNNGSVGVLSSVNATQLLLGTMGGGANNNVSGVIEVGGTNATGFKTINGTSVATGTTTNSSRALNGFYKGSSTISSVSIISSGGNLDAGTIWIYGA